MDECLSEMCLHMSLFVVVDATSTWIRTKFPFICDIAERVHDLPSTCSIPTDKLTHEHGTIQPRHATCFVVCFIPMIVSLIHPSIVILVDAVSLLEKKRKKMLDESELQLCRVGMIASTPPPPPSCPFHTYLEVVLIESDETVPIFINHVASTVSSYVSFCYYGSVGGRRKKGMVDEWSEIEIAAARSTGRIYNNHKNTLPTKKKSYRFPYLLAQIVLRIYHP
jgi:hypothetical protein